MTQDETGWSATARKDRPRGVLDAEITAEGIPPHVPRNSIQKAAETVSAAIPWAIREFVCGAASKRIPSAQMRKKRKELF